MGSLGAIFTAILLLGFLSSCRIQAEPYGDKQALLEFLQKMPPSRPLNWNFNTPVCTNWTGIACNVDLPKLQFLNLSNNHLNGTLPRNLQRFPRSSFSGNNFSASPTPTPAPSSAVLPPIVNQPQHHHTFGKISETAFIGIILGGSTVFFLVITVTLMVFYSKKEPDQNNDTSAIPVPPKAKDLKKRNQGAESDEEKKNGKMSFFEGSNMAFDLEDLLSASAEVLGKGTFGTTYKAILEDSNVVVVKRLKEVGVGKREFEQQMEVVGNIRHENVAPLRAYYYSKDEKLIVYDYFSQGSLATMLHGKADNQSPLDWETRLRIVIGAARGLAHIHTQNNGKFVHGNIKPSNVFLNPKTNFGCVADMGLATLVTPLAAPVQYRAPEVSEPRKATQASDVYSFGVLILELLTGHTPMVRGTHIVKWVKLAVREEWTTEVFDMALLRSPKAEEEMVNMLQLGLNCTELAPDKRPKMWEVVRMAESIPRGNSGTHPSSEVSTPATTPAGRSYVVDIGSTSSLK